MTYRTLENYNYCKWNCDKEPRFDEHCDICKPGTDLGKIKCGPPSLVIGHIPCYDAVSTRCGGEYLLKNPPKCNEQNMCEWTGGKIENVEQALLFTKPKFNDKNLDEKTDNNTWLEWAKQQDAKSFEERSAYKNKANDHYFNCVGNIDGSKNSMDTYMSWNGIAPAQCVDSAGNLTTDSEKAREWCTTKENIPCTDAQYSWEFDKCVNYGDIPWCSYKKGSLSGKPPHFSMEPNCNNI